MPDRHRADRGGPDRGADRRTGQVEESYPELAPLLATSCDFVIYHKSLDRPGRGPA
jgi:hypothetical protein